EDGTVSADMISGYALRIYKNGSLIDDTNTNITNTSYNNFSNVITGDTDYRNGVYTFDVVANVKDSYKNHYNNSQPSSLSGQYTVVSVTLQESDGIESLTPASSFLLLPNAGVLSVKEITATLKDNYAFAGWSGTGVSFANANATSTTVTIDPDYSGATELTIVANTTDTKAPTAGNPSYLEGNTITAQATDNESGIKAYAFTTATDVNDVVWTTLDTAFKGTKAFTYEVSAGGFYYFYVKDGQGLVTRSANSVQVTEIRYHDFYSASALQANKKGFMIGNQIYALETPQRMGWSFAGYYADSAFTNAVSLPFAHSVSGYDVYLKWEEESIGNVSLPTVDKEYNGQDSNLTVSYSGTVTGTLCYAWEKDGQPMSFTGSSLTVRNVSDSGTYSVTVTLKDADGQIVSTETANTTVSITKANLDIWGVEQTLQFGDPKPSTYAYGHGTLLGNDTESAIAAGTVSCEYVQGSPAGTYPYTLTGFTSENYELHVVEKALTVTSRTISNDDIHVTFTDGTDTFTYQADTDYTPAVTVVVNGTT
ncbi:MAG: MBG-2 domain-containing protein, partial [Erysipelotrichaceae bacterium]|nr:MBG-2 domain-containing protein [Erysipelotrichaceae bacterium]